MGGSTELFSTKSVLPLQVGTSQSLHLVSDDHTEKSQGKKKGKERTSDCRESPRVPYSDSTLPWNTQENNTLTVSHAGVCFLTISENTKPVLEQHSELPSAAHW